MLLEQCLSFLGKSKPKVTGQQMDFHSPHPHYGLLLSCHSTVAHPIRYRENLNSQLSERAATAHRVPGDPAGAGVGPGNLQRSLPTSAILGFCDSLISSPSTLTCMSKHPHFSQYNLYMSVCLGTGSIHPSIQTGLCICSTKCHMKIGFLICLEMTGS